MNERLQDALSHISDKHIAEAGRKRNKALPILLRITAAAAAIALVAGLLGAPRPIMAKAVSLAGDSRMQQRPDRDDYKDAGQWQEAINTWNDSNSQRKETVLAALTTMENFLAGSNRQFLTGAGNAVWSPANAYIGLAMAAEVTAGSSRKQILDLLGASDTDALRTRVSAIWESARKEGKDASGLANSLWLQKGLDYNQETMDALSYHYYTSVYQTNLASAGGAISAWLHNNTGGLLSPDIRLPADTILALYSTVHFQSKWSEPFKAANNTTGIFHAPSGDKPVTYMNKKLAIMNYFHGDRFGAVGMRLNNGSTMWFLLPDEGYTPTDVLADGQYLQLFTSSGPGSQLTAFVNLSVPKFDVSCQADLSQGLKSLGVTDIFDRNAANFSAITGDTDIYIREANQAVRVQIDEDGVKAAAYLEMHGPGNPAASQTVDFVLDRPFLFFITDSGIPLFSGIINNP